MITMNIGCSQIVSFVLHWKKIHLKNGLGRHEVSNCMQFIRLDVPNTAVFNWFTFP